MVQHKAGNKTRIYIYSLILLFMGSAMFIENVKLYLCTQDVLLLESLNDFQRVWTALYDEIMIYLKISVKTKVIAFDRKME